jgi:hypothetical protein
LHTLVREYTLTFSLIVQPRYMVEI